LIPGFDGAVFQHAWKDALWARFNMGAPQRQRRRAIQHSQESLRGLAKRYGINPKTVAKWRKRTSVSDRRTGPQEPRSTVLSVEDEAVVVAFRRHTLLPLDDCLYALQPTIPHLTRSSLHRCLQRHGISQLPETEGDKPPRSKFKRYPIG
jgi:transposase-like protein